MEISDILDSQVFGLSAPDTDSGTPQAPAPTNMDLLLTQRAAKRQRLADEKRRVEAEAHRHAEELRQREEENAPSSE